MFKKATFREILLPSLSSDGRSISRNVAFLNILVHDVLDILSSKDLDFLNKN